MEVELQVDAKAVLKTLGALPGAMRRRAIMPALRKGAGVVRDAAEANIKAIVSNEATGTAAKNIRVYNMKKYRGAYRVGVSVRRGAVNAKKIIKGAPVRIGLYISVLEYGKKNQRPRSWIRKAAKEKTAESYKAIESDIAANLNKVVMDAKR